MRYVSLVLLNLLPLDEALALNLSLDWDRTSNQSNSGYADRVIPIGDFNGDGWPDVAVAAGGWVLPSSTIRQGAVFIHLGNGTTFLDPTGTPADYVLTSDLVQGGGFGHSVAAGDINNDGYSDLVISGIYAESRGVVYAFYGRPGQPTCGAPYGGGCEVLLPAWKRPGPTGSLYYGWNVDTADVNCDFVDDVIISTHWWGTQELPHQGLVHLFYGVESPVTAPLPPSANADWSVTSGEYLIEFGWGLATVGDFNGDFDPSLPGQGLDPRGTPDFDLDGDGAAETFGCEDFVVGAPRYGWYESNRGRTYLFKGSSAGPLYAGRYDHPTSQTRYGEKLAAAGDVNGDGKDDLLVSSGGANNGKGVAFLVPGGDVLSTGSNLTLATNFPAVSNQRFGHHVMGIGDVNGDGHDDFAVGAPVWNVYVGSMGMGRLFIYLGEEVDLVQHPTGISPSLITHDRLYDGQGWYPGLGAAFAGTGDLDSDGFSEILIGMPSWDGTNGAPNIGKVGVQRY